MKTGLKNWKCPTFAKRSGLELVMVRQGCEEEVGVSVALVSWAVGHLERGRAPAMERRCWEGAQGGSVDRGEPNFPRLPSQSPRRRRQHCFNRALVFQGAFVGLLTGFMMSLWIGIGAQLYPPLPERTMPLYLATYGCNSTYNATDVETATEIPFPTGASQTHSVERYWVL